VLISPDDEPDIAAPADDVVMRPLVRRDRHGTDVSITWVRLDGRHRRLRTDRSTRVYYILDGTATFDVGGDRFDVRKDDVVVVPVSTPYEFWGETTYLVVNGPAFAEGDDVYS
jgi:mannose-6-phosphate isomerase-like protein (cupin superfamily)